MSDTMLSIIKSINARHKSAPEKTAVGRGSPPSLKNTRHQSMPEKTMRRSSSVRLGDSFLAKEKEKYDEEEHSRFNSSFTLTKSLLGEGTFATVKRGRDRRNKSFAVKMVKKRYLEEEDILVLQQEIDVLQTLKHPNILQFHKVYDEDDCCYIVTEIMRGGDLYDRLSEKIFYPENDAMAVCKILFDTMKYCHDKKVAHRDLKPENILLMAIDNDIDIKIADFGFAKYAQNDHSLLTQCGTPEYVAPEVLIGTPYGTKVDIWSLGVVTYALLGGYHPFRNADEIKEGSVEFHDDYWSDISLHAKDLILMLLTVNPAKRITATEALESKWFGTDL